MLQRSLDQDSQKDSSASIDMYILKRQGLCFQEAQVAPTGTFMSSANRRAGHVVVTLSIFASEQFSKEGKKIALPTNAEVSAHLLVCSILSPLTRASSLLAVAASENSQNRSRSP
mmetsp:Transcript_20519/g.50359  ORF Transcript_20519/g.50359 Transcript_20519/m.50359 type:complete len:115 (+) Transcript_20519:2175-2519(+)